MYRFPPIRSIGLTCLLVLFSSTGIAQSETDYEKQLKSLATTIDKLQKELAKTKSSRNELQNALQKSEEEIGTLTKKVESIKEALAREKKQLSQHQSRRAELEKSRQQQQQQINLIIRQAYLLGRQSQIKLLLNQEAPYRITRLLRYHDYIVEAHKEKMDVYLDTIAKITATEKSITATTERLENNQQRLNERFRELKSSQSQRLATLSTLNKELRSKGNALTQLKGDQERLERLLEEATKALSKLVLPGDSNPFRTTRGKLPQPTKGRITQYFNSPRLNGKLRWKGLFITGSLGEKVVSVHHGRVIFSDYLRGHGLLLIIDHGDGYMSLYAHNQALLKDTGDWVRSGETIATLGNTGGQTQAGLYFEIRHNGKPQNPKPWLKKG
ncbi:MAG: murein hydrolase activator EnvC family protein [Cellvibrionaceae bacterium]